MCVQGGEGDEGPQRDNDSARTSLSLSYFIRSCSTVSGLRISTKYSCDSYHYRLGIWDETFIFIGVRRGFYLIAPSVWKAVINQVVPVTLKLFRDFKSQFTECYTHFPAGAAVHCVFITPVWLCVCVCVCVFAIVCLCTCTLRVCVCVCVCCWLRVHFVMCTFCWFSSRSRSPRQDP